MLVAFSTMGDMSLSEITELKKDKICPILVYEHEGETVLPVFSAKRVCHAFLKRNLPNDWVVGAVTLTPEDVIKLCKQKDEMQAMKFDHPRKIKDVVTFNILIHEFVESPIVVTERT